jgi:hypothetical protein
VCPAFRPSSALSIATGLSASGSRPQQSFLEPPQQQQAQGKQRHATYRELPLYSTLRDARGSGHCGRMARLCYRLPRPKNLCRLLALMVGLMVAFHAASCGYFFCVRFPGVVEFPRDIYDDIRDIYVLAGEIGDCTCATSPHKPPGMPHVVMGPLHENPCSAIHQ